MSMRAYELGWRLISMHDSAHRRGIWMRENKGKLELCAGREGDDSYVVLEEGQVLTAKLFKELSPFVRNHLLSIKI